MFNDLFSFENKELWDNILNQKTASDIIVMQFLLGKLNLDYLSANYQTVEKEKCITILINSLLSTSISRIRSLLLSEPFTNEISAANIPQFSNFATAVIYLPELLLVSNTPLTYREMGYLLFSDTKSDVAAEKYGQNHGNLAMQLGLASIKKHNYKNVYVPTPLTAQYCKLEQDKKMELLQRLCFRIPIIQIAAKSETPVNIIEEYLQKKLAKSTYIRRRSNVLEVLAFALGE